MIDQQALLARRLARYRAAIDRPRDRPGRSTPAAEPGGPTRAERLAAAVGGEVSTRARAAPCVWCTSPPRSIPVDRERAGGSARPAGPDDAARSASTRRRPAWRPPPGPSPSSSASAGGRATRSARSSCSSRITPRSPRCWPRSATSSPPTPGWSRTTAGGSTGRCSSPATGSAGRPPPTTPATSTCCRSSAGCSATGWPTPGCGPPRRNCSGSIATATSTAGRSRAGTSGSCAAGRPQPLAEVVRHNDQDVRSLARLLAHLGTGLADAARGARSHPGDLAGLARAFARDGRLDEALECLDIATRGARAVRLRVGARRLGPSTGGPLVVARARPDFGTPRSRSSSAPPRAASRRRRGRRTGSPSTGAGSSGAAGDLDAGGRGVGLAARPPGSDRHRRLDRGRQAARAPAARPASAPCGSRRPAWPRRIAAVGSATRNRPWSATCDAGPSASGDGWPAAPRRRARIARRRSSTGQRVEPASR